MAALCLVTQGRPERTVGIELAAGHERRIVFEGLAYGAAGELTR